MNSEAATDIFVGFTTHEQSALDAMRAWTSSIVMVQDSAGTSPALRWKATRFLIFPTTALRKPVEAGEAFDIRALFREYTRSLPFYPR